MQGILVGREVEREEREGGGGQREQWSNLPKNKI